MDVTCRPGSPLRRSVLQRSVARLYRQFGLGVLLVLAVSAALLSLQPLHAQRRPMEPPIASQPETPQHRTRLILKDGSYQNVLSYKVSGDRVRFRSAERDGETEEIPLALVDLSATEAWARAHDPATMAAAQQAPPVLSPELAREEAARAAQTPEVAKDLRLPENDSVLVLDTFHGTPELVPLPQNGSDLNHETAHAVQPKPINPASSPHDLLLLKDEVADVQLHVPDPVFYVRLQGSQDSDQDGAGTFVVDTHGQSGRPTPSGGANRSRYVVQRVDVRQGARAVESLRLGLLGSGQPQPDVIELQSEPLPGNVWLKLMPTQPLEFGEYVLMEVLSDRAVNADVWSFGVHPTAKENDEALRPEPKRPTRLERRSR